MTALLSFERSAKAETYTDALQELLDSPLHVIDGQGKTFIEKNIIIWSKHAGKTLRNANIIFKGPSNNAIGRWLFIQGRSFGGFSYPSAELDFTFENVTITGDFTPPTDLQELNEYLAEISGKSLNLITNVTNRAGHITFKSFAISNSGQSAVALSARRLTIDGYRAKNIAKHGLGIRGVGGTVVMANDITLDRCGGSIDFHNEGEFYVEDSPDFAVVENLSVINPRGRSKVAGTNWEIYGSDWNFYKSQVNDCNLWPGFDLARHPRMFKLNRVSTTNFVTTGIRAGRDLVRNDGTIKINFLNVLNSMTGVQVQQPMHVTNSNFEKIRQRYLSGLPLTEWLNFDVSFLPDKYWAERLDLIEKRYDALNALYGTDFQPSYFAPQAIIDLMETR